MPVTQERGRQILDGDVGREDLNVLTAGRSVIRKLIAGTNIGISYTGVDAGTGDVTANLIGTIPISLGGTGATTQTWVDLTTGQSIGGLKVFNNNVGIGVAASDILTVGSTTNSTNITFGLRALNAAGSSVRSVFTQDATTGALGLVIDGGVNGTIARGLNVTVGSALGMWLSNNGSTTVLGVNSTTAASLVANTTTSSSLASLLLNYNGTTYAGIKLNPLSGEVSIGGFQASGYFPVLYADNAAVLSFTRYGAATFVNDVNVTGGSLTASGNRSATAWGVNGIKLRIPAAILTDNTSAASAVVASNMVNVFGIPTLASTNTAVTYTNAANVYIAGAPIAGTNVTLTNPYSLYVAAGPSWFGGSLTSTNILATSDLRASALRLYTAGSVGASANLRWAFIADGTESTGNAGSNISLYRYTDAGAYLGTSFTLYRNTGALALNTNTTSQWATIIDNAGTSGAHGLYVNIASGSNGIPFAVAKGGAYLLQLTNAGALTLGAVAGTGTGALYIGTLDAVSTGQSRIYSSSNASPLLVERGSLTSNISIQFKDATTSWYAGKSSAGNFAISYTNGANLALGEFQLTQAGALTLASSITATTGSFVGNQKTLTLTSSTAEGGAGLLVKGSTANKNWFIGSQTNVSNSLEFTPTTAVGGVIVDVAPVMYMRPTSIAMPLLNVAGIVTNTSGGVLGTQTYASLESSLTGLVHIAGTETITGSKTFSAAAYFTNALTVTANSGAYAQYINGRASDNYAMSAFYSNTGVTRYGYIQSHSAYGGTLAIVGDGGTRIDLDNRGLTVNNTIASGIHTVNSRTQLGSGGVYDLSGTGNNIGIAFGAGAIFSSNGAGTLTTQNLGSLANPWGNAWFGQVNANLYYINPNGTSSLYNIVNATSTFAGTYSFQAGGGSIGYGGSITAFGHSHATKAGWIVAGISSGSGGKFSVQSGAIGAGTDVFTVDATGAVTGASANFTGIIDAQSAGGQLSVSGGGTRAGLFMSSGNSLLKLADWATGNIGLTMDLANSGNATFSGSIYAGSTGNIGFSDAYFYRAAASVIRTASRFDAVGGIQTNSITQYVGSNLAIGSASYTTTFNASAFQFNTGITTFANGIIGTTATFSGNLAASGTTTLYNDVNIVGTGKRLKVGGYTWIGGSGGDYGSVGYNVGYTTTTNTYTYSVSDYASFIRFSTGGFEFLNAASGTAAAAMTPTRRMLLSNAGNLTIGTTDGVGVGNIYAASFVGSLAATNVTGGAALGLVDDTNITLSQSGSTTALLAAKTITVGWTGTLADTRIASAANWNSAYSNRITSLTVTGSSGAATLTSNVLNIPTYTLAGLGGLSLGGGTMTSGAIINMRGNDPGNGFLSFNNTLSTGNVTYRLVAGITGSSQNGFSLYNATSAVNMLLVTSSNDVIRNGSNAAYYSNYSATITDQSYAGSFNWQTIQLGNNGDNFVVGGHTTAGGNLKFYTNNTSRVVAATAPNGLLALHLKSDGAAEFYSSVKTSNTGVYIGTTSIGMSGDGTSLYLKSAGTTYLNTANNVYVSSGGDVTVGGIITATGGGFDSDLTLKSITTREVSSYYFADKVSVIKYQWLDKKKEQTLRYGYGAQELLELIPEAVYKNGETYAVDYSQVHTLLIDENTKRIQQLEKELKELKDELGKHSR